MTVSSTIRTAVVASLLLAPAPALASSHMDAPLITLDDAANTTDVYAFLSSRSGAKYLTTALAVYPFEEPGIGPNKYNFDDDVLYELHVALGNDVAKGRPTITYQFRFRTTYRTRRTILQSYLGVINDVGDAAQNLVQRYTVTKVDRKSGDVKVLGDGIVPPNNQGNATPKLQPAGQWREPRQGRRRDRGRAGPVHDRSRSRTCAATTAPSPASATTASTPTCRPCSIC